MPDICILDQKLRAVCPIHGVSIGRWEDKDSWRVNFKDEATKDQCAAAERVLASFDPKAPENQAAPPRDLLAELDQLKAVIAKTGRV